MSAGEALPVRALRYALIAAAVVMAAGLAWVLCVAHPRWSLNTFAGDDAGYYLAIARNLALGFGVSFDRIHPTNGFNPLETMLLVVVDRLFVPGTGIVGCYRASLVLSALALIGAGIALVRLVAGFIEGMSRESRGLVIATVVTFHVGFLCMKSIYGLDSPLVLLIGVIYLARVARRGPLAPGLAAGLVDGALLAALFLARVDHLPFLVAAFVVMAAVARFTTDGMGRVSIRAVSTVVLVAPYLLWSRASFGAWLPVSARIKSSFPDANLVRSVDVIRHTSLNPADQLAFALAFVIAMGLVLTWLLAPRWRARLRADDGRTAVIAMLTMYCAGRLGYMLLFSRTDVQGGYAILAHVFLLLVGLLAARRLGRARGVEDRVVLAACFAIALITAGLVVLKVRPLAEYWRAMEVNGAGDEWALARAIHDRTAQGDVLYGGAFGMLGFLADRPWINGDGVANTAEYQDALRPGALEPWLAANHVTHVVYLGGGEQVAPGVRRLEVASALHGTTGTLDVVEGDVILRWMSLRGRGAEIVVARWTPPEARAAGTGAAAAP